MAGMMKTAGCLALAALAAGGGWAQANAADLAKGATVRFEGTPGSELSPGWHPGTMLTTGQGCAMVATPDARMPGGRRYLALLFVQRLERQDGARWVEVPIKPLIEKEPKSCREAVGG